MDSYSPAQLCSLPDEDLYRSFLVDEDLGDETRSNFDFGKWEIRVGNKPLFFRLRESLIDFGIPIEERLMEFYDRYDVVLVPHRIGVRRVSGSTRLKSISVEVQFDLGRADFSIVNLFPSVSYAKRASIGLVAEYLAKLEGLGSLEAAAHDNEKTAELALSSNAKLSLAANGELQFQMTSKSLLTASMGEGSSSALFQFQGLESESEWQNIEAWSTLVVPKDRKRIAHSLSAEITTSGEFPKTWARQRHVAEPLELTAFPANHR